MNTLLVTCGHLIRHYGRFAAELDVNGVKVTIPEITGQQLGADEMRAAIVGQDLVIAGDDVIDRSVLEAGKASRLKAVIKWGIGTDSIDKTAAAELGIPVYNTPGVFSDEVADTALGYVLMLARGLHLMHDSVKAGGWRKVEGTSLHGKTAGVIGLGGIGRAACVRLAAFGMEVVGYDPVALDPALLSECRVRQAPLDEVLAAADFVVVTCALTPESFHLLSTDAFAKMKEGVRLVNVARGPVVDEAALIEALASGKVGSAALDVFEEEPLPTASPLRRFPDLVFGAHNGSNTAEAVDRVNRLTVGLALDVFGLSGQPCRLEPLMPTVAAT